MKTFIAIVVLIVLALGAFFGFVYSGLYNVAATEPDSALVNWVMSTTSDQSIRSHAQGIKPPPNLADSATVSKGRYRYDELCVVCHGAPGISNGKIGRGLSPRPPSLMVSLDDFTPGEIFWVVKNGIKMTGMPAFGPTQSDEEIWEMVSFAQALADMTPETYKEMQGGTP